MWGCDDAMKVFDFMPETNSVSWNSMICVFSGKKTEREKETQLITTNLRVFCPKFCLIGRERERDILFNV